MANERNREAPAPVDGAPQRKLVEPDPGGEDHAPLPHGQGTVAAIGAHVADMIDMRSDDRAAKAKAAERTPEALAQKRGSHLVATELTMSDAMNSADYLEVARRRRELLRQEAERLKVQDYVFYLRCKKYGHQGIHFTRNPVGRTIGPDDWVSTYRRPGQAYQFPIVCQECKAIGHHQELHYTIDDRLSGTFTPDPRHLWKIPRSIERFLEEGETRALRMPHESSNMELVEHEARVLERRQIAEIEAERTAAQEVSHA